VANFWAKSNFKFGVVPKLADPNKQWKMVEAVTGQTRLVWCTEKRDACQLWLKRHHGQLQVACSVAAQVRTLTQQQQTNAI